MTKVKNLPKAKVRKLDDQDLAQLREILGQMDKIKSYIGDLEVQKAAGLEQFKQISTNFGEIQKALEFKYGKVSINIETGVIEDVKEEANGPDQKN